MIPQKSSPTDVTNKFHRRRFETIATTVADGPTSIVYVIAGMVVGGAERQLLLLLENLDRSRFLPHLIAFTRGRWEGRFLALGAPIDVIPYEGGKLRVFLKCWRRLRQLRPYIVHTFGTVANFLGRTAAIAAGVPIIIPSERTTPSVKSRTQLMTDRALAPFTTFWITNSDHAARFYSEHKVASTSRIHVVHNAVDVAAFPSRGGSGSRRAVGTIGDLRTEKNHSELIDAMARVTLHAPDTILHVAGEGPLRSQIEAQIVRLGLDRNVVLHGCVDDMPEFLAELDIYAHTARYEGFPTAVMEAMAAGLPCVAYATIGCAELVRHEENGLLVRPGDSQALAHALLRLLRNPHLARDLGAAGRSLMSENFSVKRMVETTTSLYERALSSAFS